MELLTLAGVGLLLAALGRGIEVKPKPKDRPAKPLPPEPEWSPFDRFWSDRW